MATRVTFIIGNGLDVSLELKTRFSDFHEYVIANNLVGENHIYQNISENLETWADFEKQLGEYTSYMKKLPEAERQAESIKFHEELDKLRDDLADYLDTQEQSIEDLPEKFVFAVDENGIFDGLNDGQNRIIHRILNDLPIYLEFVSLNYTKTLEKIISGDEVLKPRGYSLQNPLHLHGTVDLYMTLGVSDETQLYEGMSVREKNDLIKSKLIDSANDGRLSTFHNMLNSSSVIVLFGTSIGETDAYLWKEIVKWLRASHGRYVVIHKFDRKYTAQSRRSVRTENTFKEAVQTRLLNHSPFNDDVNNELRQRIFIIHNSDKLFVPRKSKW